MSQQPPEFTDSDDAQAQERADERFVLAPEPPRKHRRWLSTGNSAESVDGVADEAASASAGYEPRQFDLSSLPDAEEDGLEAEPVARPEPKSQPGQPQDGLLPIGFVSEPRPAAVQPQRIPRKPVEPARPEDAPPLGFVSEVRPARNEPELAQVAPPRLGFLSREEIERGHQPLAPSVSAVTDVLSALPDEEAQTATPPLGYVSEPVVVARNPVEAPVDEPAAVLFESADEPELPPLDTEAEAPVWLPDPPEAAVQTAQPLVSEPLPVAPPVIVPPLDESADPEPEPEPVKTAAKAGATRKASATPHLQPSAALASAVADVEARDAKAEVDESLVSTTNLSAAASDSLATDGVMTAGRLLRQARARQGLSIDDIVQKTQMTLETVMALEEDRDPPQSAWVYVQGYYKRYARALNIPDAPLLGAHVNSSGKTPVKEQVSMEWAPQNVSPKANVSKHIFVVVFSVVLGVLAWWLLPITKGYLTSPETQQSAKAITDRVQSTTNQLGEQIQSKSEALKNKGVALKDKGSDLYAKAAEKVKASAQMIQEATQDPAAKQPAAKAVKETAPEVTRKPEAAELTAEPQQAAPAVTADTSRAVVIAPGMGLLELELSRQSWVSVTDADGMLLFEGMLEGDENRRFEGVPPMELFLGTATAASVRYNGQAVNISAEMRSNGTARITLGHEPS